MHNEVKIGLLGAGTVGGGVILVLKNNAKEIEKRVGVPVRIVKVFTRRPEKVTELDDSLMVTSKSSFPAKGLLNEKCSILPFICFPTSIS